MAQAVATLVAPPWSAQGSPWPVDDDAVADALVDALDEDEDVDVPPPAPQADPCGRQLPRQQKLVEGHAGSHSARAAPSQAAIAESTIATPIASVPAVIHCFD